MPFRFRRESGVLAVDAKRDGIHNQRGVLEMKYNKRFTEIHALITRAYQENLTADGEPENDIISGTLAQAIELLEQLERRVA